jgi:hypothetical protein
MPDGLDQFGGGGRRGARQLRTDTTARGADDFRAFDRDAYGEYWLTDNSRLRWRPCGATEVHAQVAVSVIVPTLTEAVRRKGTQPDD